MGVDRGLGKWYNGLMPIYEYRCKCCGKVFEELSLGRDVIPVVCASCGGDAIRLVSAPSIAVNCSGFTRGVGKGQWPAEDEAKVRHVPPEQVDHERKYTNKDA
jgi:putative FmdB family regulatory protein